MRQKPTCNGPPPYPPRPPHCSRFRPHPPPAPRPPPSRCRRPARLRPRERLSTTGHAHRDASLRPPAPSPLLRSSSPRASPPSPPPRCSSTGLGRLWRRRGRQAPTPPLARGSPPPAYRWWCGSGVRAAAPADKALGLRSAQRADALRYLQECHGRAWSAAHIRSLQRLAACNHRRDPNACSCF